MKRIMPQEIEVWYLIPALRREIAKILIKNHKHNQKEVAEILGVTEAAVSQYLSSKRGKEIKFSPKEKSEIEKTALTISKNKKITMEELYKLSLHFKGAEVICKIHKQNDPSLPKNCKLCSTIFSKNI